MQEQDIAAQLSRLTLDEEMPERPPWLDSGKTVFSVFHNRNIAIDGVFHRIASFSDPPQVIDWVSAVKDGLLQEPVQGAGDSAEIGLEAIENADYKRIAKILVNEGLLGSCQVIASQEPEYEPVPKEMDERLAAALPFPTMYRHQADAFSALDEGKSMLLSTPTASGKTLCFIPGIIDAIIKSKGAATCLCIYPLKELCNDQLKAFNKVLDKLPPDIRPSIGLMTGDQGNDQVRTMFDRGVNIVMCSPDKLHYLLYRCAGGQEWEGFRQYFLNLKFVVLDEIHSYVGSFGGNVVNLTRRIRLAIDAMHRRYLEKEQLAELAEELDDEWFLLPEEELQIHCELPATAIAVRKLQWIMSTATIGNPLSTALKISGLEQFPSKIHWIADSYAGSKGRTLLTIKDDAQFHVCTDLILKMMQMGLKGLTFVNSRKLAKSMQHGLESDIRSANLWDLDGKSSVFYGSIPKHTRKKVMDGVFNGEIAHLFTTSALEAGVDLPDANFVIILGFPGTIMSFGQRIGRCGRSSPGLVVYFPLEDVLDQYYKQNPGLLLTGQPEIVNSNPDYPVSLGKHMICAARENGIPLVQAEHYFGPAAEPVASELIKTDSCQMAGSMLINRAKFPHYNVSMRGSGGASIALKEDGKWEIEQLDWGMAIAEVFDGAIYRCTDNRGQMNVYRCFNLDKKAGTVTLKKTDEENYETQAIRCLTVKPKESLAQTQLIQAPNGLLLVNRWWGTVSQLSLGWREYIKSAEPVCTNPRCSEHNKPATPGICSKCGQGMKRRKSKKLLQEVMFDEPLVSTFSAPIVSVRFDDEASLRIRGWQEVIESGVDARAEFPPEAAKCFDSDPLFVGMHSLLHALPVGMAVSTLFDRTDVDMYVDFDDKAQPITDGFPCWDKADEELASAANEDVVGFVYDSIEGGSGAADTIFERFQEMAARGGEVIRGCSCEFGCPKCLVDHKCVQRNSGISKPLAVKLIDAVLGKE